MSTTKENYTSTFFQHLLEFKQVLVRCVGALFIVFLCLFPFANDIYSFIADPIVNLMPEGNSLISIGVISPFLTPLKMALVVALYITMPFILSQIWGFVAPALYSHEKRFAIPMGIATVILFYGGIFFSFLVVMPVIFGFMIDVGPDVVNFTPDIQHYLDFVLKVSFAFGVAFQVPVATLLLLKFGITTIANLKKNRAFIVIGAFVVGMLLTPPDIISQSMIAIPMWLLFEIGLLLAPFIIGDSVIDIKDKDNESEANEEETSGKSKEEDINKRKDWFSEQDNEHDDIVDADWDNDSRDFENDEFGDDIDDDEPSNWDGKV